jgi:excisionase family DNA binding protein
VSKKKPPQHHARPAASSASLPPSPAHTPPVSPPRVVGADRSPLPRLLTIDEVADLLRTSRKAIYTQISRGALPGVIRLPRRLLVDRARLLDWLDKRRAASLPTQGEQR